MWKVFVRRASPLPLRRIGPAHPDVSPSLPIPGRFIARIYECLPLSCPACGSEPVLNVSTAGPENMVDYVTDDPGPMFESMIPALKVRAVGTGPADTGSRKI